MKNAFLVGIMGSHAFGIDTPSSDEDKLGIFIASTNERLKRDFKQVITINGTTYYEISYFCELLEAGDLQAIQFLFLSRYITMKNWSGWLHDIKEDLLSTEVLESWLNLSSLYYSRALRIGNIRMDEKHPIEFMRFFPTPLGQETLIGEDFTAVTARGTFRRDSYTTSPINLERIGLKKLDKDYYHVFYDWQNTGRTKGMFDKDWNIQEDGALRSAYSNYVGVIHYQREKYNKYTKFKQLVESSHVASGYATKSMIHAFVLVEQILNFLETRTLDLKVKEPGFFHQLRTGEITREDCKQQYSELFDVAKKRLKDYDRHTDPTLITTLLEDIRIRYEESVNV